MMKIFLLEHKLDGFETLANTYYFIFLSSFLLLLFLLYRYFSGKRLYNKLSRIPAILVG